MKREARWIRDALEAAADISGRTEEMDMASFAGNRHIQNEVKYCFIVMAEALARLRNHSPDLARRIPLLDEIRGFRNVLAHQYDRADPEVIWESIQHDLPELRQQLESLLPQVEKPAPDDSPDFGF